MNLRKQFLKARYAYKQGGIRYLVASGVPYVYRHVEAAVKYSLPDRLYVALIHCYLYLHPSRRFKLITPVDDTYVIYTPAETSLVHTPTNRRPLSREEGKQRMHAKYTRPAFVDVDDGDTVVDVGAFIGEFTCAIANTASKAVCVEPDETNAKCVRKNTAEFDNVDIVQSLLWEESGTLAFNRTDDPTENSVFEPDLGTVAETRTVEATTLDRVANAHGIEVIDFLKLEAEGAELEILKGATETEIRKVAVDISEGQSETVSAIDVRDRITELLESRGFEVESHPGILLARQ